MSTSKKSKQAKRFLQETIDEQSPKFMVFKESYLQGKSAREAAVEAGYSVGSAKSLERKLGTSVARELRVLGIDELALARKIQQLWDAKVVKWNPELKVFEAFDDGRLQLQAMMEAASFLGAKKEITGPGGVSIGQLVVVSNIPRPQRRLSPDVPEGEIVH